MRVRPTLAIAALSLTLFHPTPTRAANPTPQFTGLLQSYPTTFPPPPSTSSLAVMTPDGPLPGTVVPLPLTLSDIAIDPHGTGYYGDAFQSVYHIDPVTQQSTTLTVAGPGITDNSWPIGITFDSTRNRVVLATLAGEGFLFSYTPGAPQWSLLASLNNVDLQSIAYRAADDALFGLPNSSGGGAVYSLYKYSPSGQPLDQIPLQYPIPGGSHGGDNDFQLLVTTDNRLAILTTPITDPSDPTHPNQPRLYLVDPTTGSISYNAVFPAPEPASLAPLATLLLRRRPRPRRA